MVNLNLGCGEFPLAGYQNIDVRDLPGVDRVCDVRNLMQSEASVHHLYAGHVLEHLAFGEGCRAIRQWWRMVAPFGDLTIVIHDVDKAVMLVADRRLTLPEMTLIIGGEQSVPEMHHRSAWSMASLWYIMDSLDDVSIEIMDNDERAPANPPWQTIMRAVKVYRG